MGKGLKGRLGKYKPRGEDNIISDTFKMFRYLKSSKVAKGKGGKFFSWMSKEMKRE